MANALTFNRRQTLAMSVSWLAAGGVLAGCSPQAPTFKSTDITGAAFAQDLKLTDHTGQVRTMADFRGKAVVVFFGFTQCPDVCPTSMTTLAEVKRLMGGQGKQLQVLFRISSLCSLQEGPVPQGTHHLGTHPAMSAVWYPATAAPPRASGSA